MRRTDLPVLVVLLAVVLSFALVPGLVGGFEDWTRSWPLLSSFAKFAVLASFGECLALRIRTKRWLQPGFGLLPRALAWGALGVAIYCAFRIFAAGTPALLASFSIAAPAGPRPGLSAEGLLAAFAISAAMNLSFGPVLMLTHKLSDAHIEACGGSLLRCLGTVPAIGRYFEEIDWKLMWGFVLKKTIPLFWIPAHTVTFLLPDWLRVAFAALLGIVLGVLLASAALGGRLGESSAAS